MQSKNRLNGFLTWSCLVILLLTPFFYVPEIHNFMTLGKIALLKILGAMAILAMTISLPKLKLTWRPSSFFYPFWAVLFLALMYGWH
jgi:hypothetical protein